MLGLTKTVLRRPVAVLVIVAGLIIFGISSVFSMQLQLTPDMEMPMLAVITVYPQAGPEEVERLVTKKIEDGLGTLAGLDTVYSQSGENQSMVMFQYTYGTDIDKAFTKMQEQMDSVKTTLPEDAKDPMIFSMDMNAAPIMHVSVDAPEGYDTYSFVTDTLQPELEKISSIAQVEASGGAEKYISVELHPELVSQYKLDISSLAKSIGAASFTMPAGTANHGSAVLDLSSKLEYKTPDQIGQIPITTGTGQIIHLSDVAYVHYGTKDPESLSRYNGSENISVSISKEQSASAVTVSKQVKKVIDRVTASYPDVSINVVYDSSETILSSLKAIFETMLLGIGCTMLVLFIFFGDFKGSLIVACSMPISLLITLILMSFMGFSLNLLTMGALVIAIGMMVDNAIVVIEMCFQKTDDGLDSIESPYQATKVVLNSIVASTITTVVVYLPLAVMKGLSGQMFAQLGYTIVFAMLASLLCAITVVPLCYAVFNPKEKKDSHVNHFLNWVSEKYAKLLSKALKHKLLVAVVSIAIFVVSIFMCKFLNMELMSSTDEGQVSVTVNFRPGTRMEFVDVKVRELEDFVASSEYIDGYSATSAKQTGSINAYIAEGCKLGTADVVDEWTQVLKDYEDNCEISVSSSSSMGMTSGGGGNSYDVMLQSRDLDLLKSGINDISDTIKSVPGVISVSSNYGTNNMRAKIDIDSIKATAAGLTPQMVAGTVYTVMNGSKAMEVSIGDENYDVTVEYPKDEYEDINDVYNMVLTNTKGQPVALADVADIVLTDSPESITKQNGWYKCNISATFNSNDRFTVQAAIDDKLNNYIFPQGVEKTTNTMQEMMMEEFTAIFKAIATAILLIYMVMAIEFNNLRYSAMVMFCIPFALIGSIGLLLLTHSTVNMVSLMGFLMLVGIVVNNGILYVDFTNQLRSEGMHADEALIETGKSRLRPILMTTLTTILSMVPMGIGIGKNGKMMQGMAVVIIGGLIASTILTLILLPTFYMIIHKKSYKGVLGKFSKLRMRKSRDNVVRRKDPNYVSSDKRSGHLSRPLDDDELEIIDLDDEEPKKTRKSKKTKGSEAKKN